MVLNGFFEDWDIVFLINLFGYYNKVSCEVFLVGMNIGFLVVMNIGLKGGVVVVLFVLCGVLIVFIDDSLINYIFV